MLFRVISILIGYLLGCVQSAEIVQKTKKLPGDIRKVGTGNPGTSNMTGQYGFTAGILTLALDIGKAVVSIGLTMLLFPEEPPTMAVMYAGLGAVVGHCWPVQRRFRGGRGIACMYGVSIMLSWMCIVMVLAGEVLGAVISRLMIGGAFGAMLMFLLGLFVVDLSLEERLVGVVIWGLIMVRHVSKFKSIASGEETRFSFSKLKNILKKKSDDPGGNADEPPDSGA